MWRALIAAGALSVASALPAAAATLLVDSGGFLTGASGVTVGTKTYNVEFLVGSCQTLFKNCAVDPVGSELPSFAFTTADDALAAAQSLSAQVFLDTVTLPDTPWDNFDSIIGLTRGCWSLTACNVITPYSLDSFNLALVIFTNQPLVTDAAPAPFLFAPSDAAETFNDSVYAVWTEVTPIPLPAGAPLVLTGLAAFAGLRWRNRREGRRAQV
jgi:hypothetical protein